MVKIYSKGGVVHHVPPYTEEEEDMIYRGMDIDGPVTILHAPRPSSTPLPPPRKSPPPREMNDEQLEAHIRALIDRRNTLPEGSPEYEAIVQRLGELYDSDDRAGLIAEEYNSLLATLHGTIDE
jgi:hypothetical protein